MTTPAKKPAPASLGGYPYPYMGMYGYPGMPGYPPGMPPAQAVPTSAPDRRSRSRSRRPGGFNGRGLQSIPSNR